MTHTCFSFSFEALNMGDVKLVSTRISKATLTLDHSSLRPPIPTEPPAFTLPPRNIRVPLGATAKFEGKVSRNLLLGKREISEAILYYTLLSSSLNILKKITAWARLNQIFCIGILVPIVFVFVLYYLKLPKVLHSTKGAQRCFFCNFKNQSSLGCKTFE